MTNPESVGKDEDGLEWFRLPNGAVVSEDFIRRYRHWKYMQKTHPDTPLKGKAGKLLNALIGSQKRELRKQIIKRTRQNK